MLSLFLAVYVAVLVVEIVGDKLLYTTAVLTTRYRTTPILVGMALAFMAKMGVAVAVGKAISKLPTPVVVGLTTASFLGAAYALWKKPIDGEEPGPQPASRAALVSFAAIFFSEWGDIGQVTAASLAARYGFPLVVWLGSVSAMVTKGALAASFGAGIRESVLKRVSPVFVRSCGVGALLILGVFSVLETLMERHA